ncbi:uncharacterized protein LOC125239494 [Leguminivora glycinivorella]|uniref:uncharacterized protein LOC125239494 n=1 Tax=Leguminivora glycinivorella TaxID=1035111 RepID=UPI00201098A7|nr:uncharacterized protein LOC125239494 [Leguminivora glycinivorella]
MYYLYEDNYSYICAICMFKSRTLLEVTPKRRFLLEAIVSMENHTELAEYVRTSHLMLCNDCSRLVNTMLKFQQTVVRGLTNLIVLRKLSDERSQTSHNLPEVINADTDLLLPVVNEEIVSTADSPPPVFEPVVGKNARGLKNCKVVSLNELRNLKISELINVSNQINSPKYRPPILKKEPKKQRELKKKAKPEEDVDRCCDSDFCLSCNPQNVPGCQLLVTKSQMDHEYSSTNTNEMAVLLPINNAIEKHESTNTIQSSQVKKTKLNRQLYQAIQLALKSRSITDFDIDQYEPESKSDFEYELDDIPNTKNHQNHSNSTQDDLLDASKSSDLGAKSPDHDSNSSHTKSCPDSEVTLSCESDYGGHDSKSSHDGSKSCFDSEMTLSCESDYEDAENFPNIMLAKAFRDVECRVEDGEKNVHVVWDPPSEWPCSVECCPLTEDGSSSDEVPEIPEADDKPKTNVSQWRRIECKLCGKKFVSLYRLFEHYER